MREIGILGGGIAGLSLAYFIGEQAEVLEKNSRSGGLCRSFQKDGFTFDLGGHILFSKDAEILDFVMRTAETTYHPVGTCKMGTDAGAVVETALRNHVDGDMMHDAIRAAEFHLYYPEHLLVDGLKPYRVPLLLFYYAASEANYFVDITSVVELKLKAASQHVSQWEPSINKYRPDWEPSDLEKLLTGLRARAMKKDGKFVEGFRRATGFNPQ